MFSPNAGCVNNIDKERSLDQFLFSKVLATRVLSLFLNEIGEVFTGKDWSSKSLSARLLYSAL